MSKRVTPRPRRILTTLSTLDSLHPGHLAGWLQGRQTYLWFGEAGDAGRCMGILEGRPLHRLAKAIVRHFEQDR